MNKISYIHEHKFLKKKQVENIFLAGENAYKLGCPLNRFITIHYDRYAHPKRPQEFVVKLMEHTRKWLKRRNIPVAYLYVIEKGKYKGIHVHLLLHIPAGKQVEFKKALRRWLPFEVKMPHINFKSVQYPSYGNLSPMNTLYGRLRYICKGINPQTPMHQIEPKFQGSIMGRRWGISRLISR